MRFGWRASLGQFPRTDPSLRWGDELTLRFFRHASEGWHPPTSPRRTAQMKGGWVYIMTNMKNGTLYIGVTANLPARVVQHREGTGSGFCKRYGLTRLVYAERHDRIEDAIAREKAVKAWQRAWKLRLIGEMNPSWDDLFLTINA